MCQKIKLLVGFITLVGFTLAQVEIVPVRTDTPPVLDGRLDDDVWQQAPGYEDFETFQPDYGKPLSERTVAWVAYDRGNLYFAFKCYDSQPDLIKSTVTKWDNLFPEDWVGVALDALNDQQSAYVFAVNAHGSQGDLLTDSEGNGDGSEDYIWDAAGTLDSDGFSVEMRVPLQSIRFNMGREVLMGIAFVRRISRSSEQAAYPPFHPEEGAMTTQLGKVVFRDLLYRRTYEILPSFTQSENSGAQGGKLQRIDEYSGSDAGLTAKVGVTPTLTLDLTVNPDFSQIESDASQVDVNLRYPNFYPEKRPFFLEGIKNFDIAGIGNSSAISNVIHTRMIADPSFGMKLTGKLGRSNALAAMITRDESTLEYDAEKKKRIGNPADFGIVRYKRLLKDESYVGGILTAREHDGGYNRVTGVDGLWRLTGTMKIEGNAFYGLSKDPNGTEVTEAHNADLSWSYGDRNYYARVGVHDISKDFRLDTGYIPRDGTTTINLSAQRTFYFNKALLQRLSVSYWGFVQQDKYHFKDDGSSMYDGRHNISLGVGMTRSIYVELDYTLGSEVYQGELFDRSGYEADMNGQILKSLFVSTGLGMNGSPWYDDPENPFQGDKAYQFAYFNFQPTENFSSELTAFRETFTDRRDTSQVYDARVLRSKITYQLNKYIFLRAILDYTDYNLVAEEERPKKLLAELLAGFVPFPGTVLYLGYGSSFSNVAYDAAEKDYLPANQFTEMKRGLFFKASYNWRL